MGPSLKRKRETIVLMDDNIDTNVNSYHNSANSVGVLYDRLMNHLYENNLTQHNFKLTHFSRIFKPSCIDHIYSNCPLKIDNVTTHTNSTSDHSIVTAYYHSKNKIYGQKFVKIRDKRNLTINKLT